MRILSMLLAFGAPLLVSAAPGQPWPAGRFADPPAETRILKIIHSWPDETKAQDALRRRLRSQGFGGVVCNVSFQDYLESEPKWDAFTRAVKTARADDFVMWLYDEKGYPSGNAGGLVLRDHPEWEALGLLIADREWKAGALALDLPPGKLRLAAAFKVNDGRMDLHDSVDLSGKIRDGAMRWMAPVGPWRVMLITESPLYQGTHAELNLAAKIPYPNLLMPEPTARFLALTHDRYATRLGPDLGRYFEATFTDEPSLMSLFLRAMPYRVLPWSPNLPVEFKKRRGYDLEPVLPRLIAEAGADGRKNRYDFWKTVGGLVADNFFGQIQTWGQRHHVPSGGHLLMEEDLVNHVPLYGDFFSCARRLDAPGIDCLTSVPSQVPWQVAKLMGSVAELEERGLVMSETSDHSQRYRPAGDARPKRSVSEAEIRGTCNRLMVSGVNRITSYYTFDGLDDESLRRLNQWVGRCGLLLSGGHQVTDVAVLYPVESIWPKFRPARHLAGDSPDASGIESIYRGAMDALFYGQRDFTVVDGQAVLEAEVEAGRLIHGKHRWRVLVLPGADTLPWAAWEKLEGFVDSGGVVIALGSRPANSEREFPSDRVQAWSDKIFGPDTNGPAVRAHRAGGAGIFLPTGSESLLATVLGAVVEPDLRIDPPRSPVRATHRRIKGSEVYFLINDGGDAWDGEVDISAWGKGERWDPATGQVESLQTNAAIRLNLDPYGGMFLRFENAVLPRRLPLSSGSLPGLVLQALPASEPILASGQFVRGVLEEDASHSQDHRPAWRATGVLTKSDTDTFQFVRLRYSELPDLRGVSSLVVDTWVPEGQETSNQLLVILHEEGGGDYLARTGRWLSGPGYARTYIPLNQFELAGWSADSDYELDRTRVKEISLGWGGYLGRDGERVEFSFTAPQTGANEVGDTP